MERRSGALLLPLALSWGASACHGNEKVDDPHDPSVWEEQDDDDGFRPWAVVPPTYAGLAWGRDTDENDFSEATCEVRTHHGVSMMPAQVQASTSTIQMGMVRDVAELDGSEVVQRAGSMRFAVGEIRGGVGAVFYGPAKLELAPLVAGETSLQAGAYHFSFESSGCSDQEVLLGAIHLAAFGLKQGNVQ